MVRKALNLDNQIKENELKELFLTLELQKNLKVLCISSIK